MKFKIIYTLFIVLASAFLFLNSSSGRAFTAGEGNTGAPGDNAPNGRTCVTCHNSGDIQVSLDIAIFDLEGNPVESYIPDQTYEVKVTINDQSTPPISASEFGFQMVSLIDDTQNSTDSWSNPAGNVRIAEANNNRSYAEHKGPSASNEFLLQWTAPAAGSGPVTFYAAGNGVNGNGNNGGDGAALKNLNIAEDPSSSSQDLAVKNKGFSLFPNPAASEVFVETTAPVQDALPVHILSTDGRVIARQLVPFFNGRSGAIDVSSLNSGIYWLQFTQEGKPISQKLIKR